MSDPFTKVFSIADSFQSNGSGSNKVLSIEIVPGGFSFLVVNNQPSVPRLLESFSCTTLNNPDDWVIHLPAFMKQEPALFGNFEKVRLLCYHPQYTLLPSALFLNSAKSSYLNFCGTIPQGFAVQTDKLPFLDAYGVYPISESLLSVLKQQFVDFQLFHPASILIESALRWLNRNSGGFQVLLHVKNSFFEILLFDNAKLLFYNAFAYQTFSDLMYYVFYVLEQHAKDPGQLQAAIVGDVDTNLQDYQYLSSYFRKMFVFYPPGLSETYLPQWGNPGVRFFNLFNSALCE